MYAESKPLHWFPMRDCKLVTVKVQTNIMELLAIEEVMDARQSHGVIRGGDNRDYNVSEEEYVEENLGGDYAKGLVDNVIE